MNSRVQAWAPKGALIDGALTAHIETLARVWAQHWFGTERRAGARAQDGASFPSAREAPVWTSASGIKITLGANAPLGLWMLGLSPHGQVKPNDEALLAKLSSAAARDLAQRAEASLLGGAGEVNSLANGGHERTDHIWSLSLGSASNVAHLIMSPALATQARLKMLPPPRTRRRLSPRAHAIARQRIEVGAMIGTAKIAIAEMRALSAGDIVLLDRGPGDVCQLTINRMRSPLDACELREDAGHLALRLATAKHVEETTGS